jgi:3-hydroxymyristoyl/3-hydroxydecanoyl-(acyl carrier protein) dehydratase
VDAFADVTVRDGVARSVVRREHAEALCAGHFPGDPLLPGSALLGLMASLAGLVMPDARLVGVDRCTFRTRVRPDARIVVRATRDGDDRVVATVRADGAASARATLRFAS